MCSTEVDEDGYGKLYNWGWCGEGCPLGDSTWGTDETLTVSSYNEKEIDEDIYLVLVIVTGAAFLLAVILTALKCHGMAYPTIF